MVGGPSATTPPQLELSPTSAEKGNKRVHFSHWHTHTLFIDSVGHLNRHSICYVESAVYKFNQYNSIQYVIRVP